MVVRPGASRGAHTQRNQLAHREVARDCARAPDDGRGDDLPRVAADELRARLQTLRSRLVRVRVRVGEGEGWGGVRVGEGEGDSEGGGEG